MDWKFANQQQIENKSRSICGRDFVFYCAEKIAEKKEREESFL